MQPHDAHNITWTTPSKDASESMPCGGGDVGLNVWVKDGDLLIYLSRSGCFDELNRMPKLGRVRVRIGDDATAQTGGRGSRRAIGSERASADARPLDAQGSAGASPSHGFVQTLRLREGFIRIEMSGVTIDVWVDVFSPRVHVEVASPEPVVVQAWYEHWRLAPREMKGFELHACRSWIGAPEPAIEKPDVVDVRDDVVRFVHHNEGRTAFDLCVDQQHLNAVKDQMWNPLAGLTFGGAMWGDGFALAGESDGVYASTPFRAVALRSAPATAQHLHLALHVGQAQSVDDWHRELDALRSAPSEHQPTLDWWQAFWQRSHIVINDGKGAADLPWQVGRNYQLMRYQLGCNARSSYPTKFNGGLFTFDPVFVDPKRTFSPDFRMWSGGAFTAQNQRLLYWPLLKSGDFDLLPQQLDFYVRALGNASLRVKHYWGFDEAACFTEQMEQFGLPVTYEYGWKRPADLHPGVEANAWVDHQWDTVFEFCLMALDLHAFAHEDITRYLPLIERSLNFYRLFYKRDGKFEISPGTALETYKNAVNPTNTICALRSVIDALLELPDSIYTDSCKAPWRAMRDALPPIAFREMNGRRTISPAHSWTHKQNCEFPHLYPVFPWRQFGIGRPDLQTAIDTWHHGADAADQKQIQSWHQDAIFCARLGLTDEAAQLTIEKLKDAPRRFPTFWGPGHDWVPDHNWGGSGMIGLQEMLVQTVGDAIYLLPAWPREWDVDFKLHLPGRTTIECTFRNGAIERLVLDPPQRMKDVVRPEK
jgi:hypothetical protein